MSPNGRAGRRHREHVPARFNSKTTHLRSLFRESRSRLKLERLQEPRTWFGYPIHQSILAFDIEGFTDSHRDDNSRLSLRAGFYTLTEEAFEAAGVPWAECWYEDRGDGAIVLVPPHVPKVLLLDPLLGCLSAALTDHNRAVPVAQRFRLRCAVHAGEVASDAHGLAGTDLVTTCRMLDAGELRAALRRSRGDVAVIVSELIYEGIVRHRYRGIDPVDYHPVSVQVKKTRLRGWIHLPGGATLRAVAEPTPSEHPRQLPPMSGTFVGREREVALLEQAGGLVVLVGPPGVGTSALATHWAHRIADRYPDGQLYADLGGPARPVAPAHILRRFLLGLGVSGDDVPEGLTERTALFRALTADLRLLVVLDNASAAADVRAMLPARRCMTVVTGPSRLGGLTADGADLLRLAPLSGRDGLALLEQRIGAARVAAEPSAAGRLVRLCGGLPVALCAAGTRLATRPQWTLEEAVADLVDGRRRLARLTFGDEPSAQDSFDACYRALPAPVARTYRLLGLHPGPYFGVGVAAAMVGGTVLDAERHIEELLNANLLDEPRAGRYRFHPLLRLHARQHAEAEDPADARTLAMHRMLDWYLHTATLAGQVITPHRMDLRRDVEHVPAEPVSFDGHLDALAWLDRDRVNLLSATRYARQHGMCVKAGQLAEALWGLFLFRAGIAAQRASAKPEPARR